MAVAQTIDMADQANLAPPSGESQPGPRPQPKAAPGVKIVAGFAATALILLVLATWALIRALR